MYLDLTVHAGLLEHPGVMHHGFGGDLLLWIFFFADDWHSGGRQWNEGIVLLFFLFRVLDVPISWKKAECGFKGNWTGMEEWGWGLSSRKPACICRRQERVLEERSVAIAKLVATVNGSGDSLPIQG